MRQQRGFLRSFVFGAEDSLVSTVGLLSGVSFAGLSSRAIIMSGIVLIIAESTSMAAGVYISEDSTNELPGREKDNQLSDALVMLFSYLLVGLIPLSPYLKVADTRVAFYYSVVLSLVALFGVGIFKGYFVHHRSFFRALKMVLIGGGVILLSIAVGKFVSNF